MKIGILTYHRALNYGAVLQCYALYKTLEGQGHDVEVVDYRPSAIEKYRMLFRWKDFVNTSGLVGKLRYSFSSITLILSKHRTSRKFDTFLSNNIRLSRVVKSPIDVPHYYECIVFGSDQIWNPENNEGIDDVYLGNFKINECNYITYAVSAGRESLLKKQYYNDYKKAFANYSSISVREETLRKCIEEDFGISTHVVCDPSLFLSKDICSELAIKPRDEHYVLIFDLIADENIGVMANRIAKERGCKVIEIKAVTNPCHRYPFDLRADLSPAEFLGYIMYADFVVTNSFHATSFSLIMHKDFYTTLRPNNNDRAKTLLKKVGLSDRIVDSKCELGYSEIDYSVVERQLNEYKESSLNYLMEQLRGSNSL